jgi:hypothetical protein
MQNFKVKPASTDEKGDFLGSKFSQFAESDRSPAPAVDGDGFLQRPLKLAGSNPVIVDVAKDQLLGKSVGFAELYRSLFATEGCHSLAELRNAGTPLD